MLEDTVAEGKLVISLHSLTKSTEETSTRLVFQKFAEESPKQSPKVWRSA